MREINVSEIENTIRDLCISANIHLPKSLEDKIQSCAELEISPAGKAVFEDLKANINAAKAENIPICQDTGMAVIFMEIGQDVHFTGGSFEDAINKGVSRGYTEGYLRCSIVGDPLERVNTGDNTAACCAYENSVRRQGKNRRLSKKALEVKIVGIKNVYAVRVP